MSLTATATIKEQAIYIEKAEAESGVRAAAARRRWLGNHLIIDTQMHQDAWAIFAGHWTHLSHALVIREDVHPATLDAIESFYANFASPTTIHVSSDFPRAIDRLNGRGYRLLGDAAVLGYTRDSRHSVPDDHAIWDADEEEWVRTACAGFVGDDDVDDDSLEIGGVTAGIDGAELSLMRVDGEPAATGALLHIDEAAILFCDSTRAPFRGSGLHKRLIRARVERALSAGAERIVATVEPASPSERNYRACGFERLYSRLTVRKP